MSDKDKSNDVSQSKCQQEACAIQTCLANNNYQESRCESIISAWKLCTQLANGNASNKATLGTEQIQSSFKKSS
jgi:hypothetical protein